MFIYVLMIAVPLLSLLFLISVSKWPAHILKERSVQRNLYKKSQRQYEDFIVPAARQCHPNKNAYGSTDAIGDSLCIYKTLYHKLQNLEQYPEIIQECWDTLLSFLDEAVAISLQTPESGTLALTEYSHATASVFLNLKDTAITKEWEQYLCRRKAGSPRELFGVRDEAINWLKTRAPVKLVDGAWLGHVHKTSTPFPLRHITKDAWQIMSEELGDGDLKKNHVQVYDRLLKSVGLTLPRADSIEFTHSCLNIDDIQTWKAGLAQLLISLFPHDFLPEILGFNLHFESLTLDTLMASEELAELKIDPYYFMLHITIDNADSGHSAIALQAVSKYIEHVQTTQGGEAARKAWRRVQAGYMLSESGGAHHTINVRELSELEVDLLRIFKSKSAAAYKVHRNSRLRIGRHTLIDWLQPDLWDSAEHQRDFLLDLSNCPSYIHRGNSKASRFIKELEWGGKMFGAFTRTEIGVLERWINSQTRQQDSPKDAYRSFTGLDRKLLRPLDTQQRDVRIDYPVLLASYPALYPKTNVSVHLPNNSRPNRPVSKASLFPFNPNNKLSTTPETDIPVFLSLWFTHPCLLETAITIPTKTTTLTASAIVRILRAQSGFGIETPGVDGMDEARRNDSIGLVELGLEMARRSGNPVPSSVKEALEWWPSEFAVAMLHAAMRPSGNLHTLVGLAWAFMELHEGIAGDEGVLLSQREREVLGRIAGRERMALGVCLEEMEEVGGAFEDFWVGYTLGRGEIKRLL